MPSEVSTAGVRHDPEPTLEELKQELAEARRREGATADVLKAIGRSAFDLQKVLDTLIEAAAELCGAKQGVLRRREGDSYPLAATYGIKPEWRELIFRHRKTPEPGTLMGRVALAKHTLQIPDVFADPEFPNLETAKAAGFRAIIGTPLLCNGEQIGFMSLHKETACPFSRRQVELCETFADQAVIAIENTLLFEVEQESKRELQEALEYQTATSDVLDVISRTPNELQPVFDAIVETAARLCHAESAHVFTLREGMYHLAASNRGEAEFKIYLRQNPIVPGQRGSVTAKAAAERRTIHVPDTMVDPDTNYGSGLLTISKNRTVLSVPLMRDDEAIGVITLARKQPKPFADKQIQLVTTFADQAVIAIENTRLFEAEQARTREVEAKSSELAQSLDYQTAISDVLGVISRSQFDLQPVLQSVVETAARLCRADNAIVYRLEESVFRLAAGHGHDEEAMDAVRSNPFS